MGEGHDQPRRADQYHALDRQRQRAGHRHLCRPRLECRRQCHQQQCRFDSESADHAINHCFAVGGQQRERPVYHQWCARFSGLWLPRLGDDQPRVDAGHGHLDPAHQRRFRHRSGDLHRSGKRSAATVLSDYSALSGSHSGAFCVNHGGQKSAVFFLRLEQPLFRISQGLQKRFALLLATVLPAVWCNHNDSTPTVRCRFRAGNFSGCAHP